MNNLIDRVINDTNTRIRSNNPFSVISEERTSNGSGYSNGSNEDRDINVTPYSKCDPYNDNRIVTEKYCDMSVNMREGQKFFVKYPGSMENVIRCSKMFLEELSKKVMNNRMNDNSLVLDNKPGELWTKSSIGNYLKHIWLKLIEQNKVVFIDLSKNENDKMELGEMGISQYCYLFEPNLCDVKHDYESIVLLAVQQDYKKYEEPMILLSNFSILRRSDRVISKLLRNRVKGELGQVVFEKPFYYDHKLEVDIKDKHIIGENLDRLIRCGLVDYDEVNLMDKDSKNPYNPQTVNSIEYSKVLSNDRSNDMYNKVIRKDKDIGRYELKRKNCGHRCILSKIKEMVDNTRRISSMYGDISVPYLYYEKDVGNCRVFKGSCQLIIPLLDNDMKPRIALSIIKSNGKYNAITVLHLEDVYRNARVLGVVNTWWFNK